MSVENSQLHDFILWLWGLLEKAENELLAREVTLVFLKTSGGFPEIDELAQHARANPSPVLEGRHRDARETIERLLAEQNPGDALMQFLREWKPQGPIQVSAQLSNENPPWRHEMTLEKAGRST
jgi:hypothetical protein